MDHLHKSQFNLLIIVMGLALSMAVASMSTSSVWSQSDSPRSEDSEPTARPTEDKSTPGSSSTPEEIDPNVQRMLEQIAQSEGISADRLLVGYYEVYELPLTGASFTYLKAVDRSSGVGYSLGLDRDGKIVDPEALRQAEQAAVVAIYGKLHPSLYNHIQGLSPQDRVTVSIWLDMGGREASLPRIMPAEAKEMSLDEIRQDKAEHLALAAQIYQEVEDPLLEFLPKVDGQVLSADQTAPIVFVELPVRAIKQVANLPYVQVIDLVVEGGPEQTDGDEKQPTGGSEMATARPASKANIVEARGINGNGVSVAVVEGDSIAFTNPYLVDGTCGPTATCPTIDEHPTAVGGIIASTHATARGTAPGIGALLLSANGSGWELPHMQNATSWALSQGADVLNNSYYLEYDGAMHNSDRWMDYQVRNNVVLEVKSAGNRGEDEGYVTSPGLGYNTLTVGAAEDKDTITWDDDTMAEISSYVEPAGREKPEVSATGCGEWVTGVGGQPGIVITGRYSPWIYDQGCGTSYAAPIVAGGGALLIQRAAGLDGWPEAEKAILIATALHNIEGDARRSEIDGAGAVDLAAADAVAANSWWGALTITPGMFDVNNRYTLRTMYLYAGERVRAALAYDSNPSADYSTDPLEGDLDLYLYNESDTIIGSSTGIDSWEIIDTTVPANGLYTLKMANFGGSFSGSEWSYGGFAIWPGHYVLDLYVPQSRDTPPGSWNRDSGDDYRLTRGSFWNAIGIRSPVSSDYDIFLFDNSVYADPADHNLLEDSTMSTTVDFVVIDGNHAPSGNYYTTVSAYNGTGNYLIEHASSTTDVLTGQYGVYTMTPSSIVRVWDSSQANGVRKYYALKPTSGDADLGMALFDTDSAAPATLYQGRSQYVNSADSTGAGGNEFMNYQSTSDDWYGLVVWNNAASVSTSYFLYADTTEPSGSIAINGGAIGVNTTAVTLNLNAEDSQTGVYQMHFSNNGSTWSDWVAYAATSGWTLPAGDGVKTVYVQFKNNAEMISETYSDSIILDSVAPTGSILINSGATYSNSTSVTLTLSASDALSGMGQMRFSNNGSTWSAPVTYAASSAWTLSPGDGTKTVYVQFIDNAGNISASYSDTVLLDSTPPSGTISINGGDLYTISTGVTLTLSASDGGSGLTQMRFSNDGSSWTVWESYAASKAWTLTGGDGAKTVYVQYRDALNNGSGSFTDSIVLDTTAPSGTIVINSGAAYVTTTGVTLTLSATDAGSGVAQMRFSNDGASWSSWEVYAASKAWTVTGGDGAKTVYVQYRDALNNGSGSFTDSIHLDADAPTGTISINSGSAYVNTTGVTLTLTAADSGSDVAQMRFSNDGASWAGWEGYTTSKAWTLAGGDGAKTVYVQFTDLNGHVSGSISDTIILDTVAPSSTASSPASSSNLSFTVSWTGSDAASYITAYDVQYRSGSAGVWTDWLSEVADTSAVFGPTDPVVVERGETYFFRVRARDEAGNLESYADGDGDTSTYIEVIVPVYLPFIHK